MQSAASYCTPTISDLPESHNPRSPMHQVPWERLRVVDLGRPVLVGGTRVTFLDANHCPGAAMALLEPPGRPPILHTGDCRHDTTAQYFKAQSNASDPACAVSKRGFS